MRKMRREVKRIGFVVGLAGMIFVCGLHIIPLASAEEKGANIILNPSAEDAIGKRTYPANWGTYHGSGKYKWGFSESEFHTGKRSAFLTTTELGEWHNRPIINCALIAGNSNGYTGKRAYKAEPDNEYSFSFWIKGDIKSVEIQALGFNAEGKGRQFIKTTVGSITPTDTWKKYKGYFITKKDTKKFALHFYVKGVTDDSLGTIYVDDVYVSPTTGTVF